MSGRDAADWHAWLAAHDDRSLGVLLFIAKRGAKRSITYAEAVDGALAWGWIESQKRALDAAAWLQRFTPRKTKSPWSKINSAEARLSHPDTPPDLFGGTGNDLLRGGKGQDGLHGQDGDDILFGDSWG